MAESALPGRGGAPFIIGVAGGTASGKTSVCRIVMEKMGKENEKRVVLISMDSFYRVLDADELTAARTGDQNFDHPNSFDWELLLLTLDNIRRGIPTHVPTYSFVTHSRTPETTLVDRPAVVLIEGILILYDSRIRDLLSMTIFTDEDSETRLARRVERDISERGRDITSVLRQYLQFVKPAFDDYIFPTKKYADIIFPRGRENIVAIDVIVQHILDVLHHRRIPQSLASRAASLNALEFAEISH